MHHEASCALLGDDAHRRFDALVDDLMRRQREEVPELWVTDDPALGEAVHRSTRDNSELMVALIRRSGALPRWLPAGARLEAELAAQYGAGLDALLRTYAVGQHGLTEHFLAAIEERDAIADPVRALRELRVATRRIHAYMSAVTPLVAREYQAEVARLRDTPDLARLRRVQAALAGDAGTGLDHDLAAPQLAVVGADPALAEAVAAVAAQLGCAALTVRAPGGRCWGWLVTDRAEEVAERLRRHGVAGPAGLGGPDGFAAAHRQAHLAERVARSRRQGLVDLRTAALEALALGDQRTAWHVAQAELCALVAEPRHDALLGTLEAWFAARESVAETARALHVAPRTVSYRLRRAEHLLGHPIASRRAELEAALRLRRLFGDGEPPATP